MAAPRSTPHTSTASDELAGACKNDFEAYDYKAFHSRMYDFCNQTLSAEYLAAVKDPPYCDKSDSPRRRAAQRRCGPSPTDSAGCFAPVLPHTADETYRSLLKTPAGDTGVSVHLTEFRLASTAGTDPGWAAFFKQRDGVLQALEKAKASSDAGGLGIENPLDGGVVLPDRKAHVTLGTRRPCGSPWREPREFLVRKGERAAHP